MLIQYGSGKNDTIKITGENTYVNKIQSNGGDDTITVEKGATTSHKFENEGNSGKLHIEEDIIDFSNVKQITNVKLGEADNNLNLKLTAEDIFRNNNLVIDGEKGDRLDMVGSGLSKGELQDGYTTYSGKYVDEFGVTTDVGLRIKDEVHVDL